MSRCELPLVQQYVEEVVPLITQVKCELLPFCSRVETMEEDWGALIFFCSLASGHMNNYFEW